jgi:hypothetical protein
VVVPVAARCCGLDRNAALLFLLHEVGRRFTVMYFTRAVNLARQFQDAFRRRGLTRIDVRENTNVAVRA